MVLFQLGYLVDDLESAILHWARTMRAGPFFVLLPRVFHDVAVEGAAAEDRRLIDGVALGQMGAMQVELIVPGPAASTYRRFLAAGQHGLHHLGLMSRAYDADRANLLTDGYAPETEARTALTRIAYLRPPASASGSIVELVEHNRQTEETFGMIRRAAEGWNGSDPVRQL